MTQLFCVHPNFP